MLSHKLQAEICKNGYLELMNLPFKAGTQIEITISRKKKKKNFKRLIDKLFSLIGGLIRSLTLVSCKPFA